ncbi:MAG TPA: hypothetical protein VJ110_02110 [Candidatus Nanoarchaeia archaeon]|nr:hypothetical protein [Candidatus Nanoarchaeia archaeon]
MALKDIFKRKKKDEFLDLGAIEPGAYGPASGGGYPGSPPVSGEFPTPFPTSPQAEYPQYPAAPSAPMPMAPSGGEIENLKQQMEAINYKLDSLRAILDTLSTRIANIENALKVAPFERQGGY